MSETNQAEGEQDEQGDRLTKGEFFERVRLEGVTIDGTYYATSGAGRSTRYHAYDPGLVTGLEPIEDDGEVVGQAVENHDSALVEDVSKGDLEDSVYPKVADGFGSFGIPVTREPEEADGDDGGDDEPEPMTEDEVLETIQENYGEHGFFTEDEDGEAKVVSLAHPGAKPMGYIVGSHVKALPNDLETVDDYREAVTRALNEAGDSEAPPHDPDEVPIAPDDLMETFEDAGGEVDEETREKLSRQVRRRWEDGEYDHLRKDDSDGEEGDD